MSTTNLAELKARVKKLEHEIATDSWTREMQEALGYIPVEFVGNDAWQLGVKRLAEAYEQGKIENARYKVRLAKALSAIQAIDDAFDHD